MANLENYKNLFDSLATDGFIGDRHGKLAYCYLRVSSSGQAGEGTSGLPRQIQHIHDVAVQKGYRVPWDLVFADEHTGFEFKDRIELSRLRREYKSIERCANAVIIESLDRLSRNAIWHQGFLIGEMNEYGLEVIFWKSFSSRIEGDMMGIISQEGMEQEKQRMSEGNLFKARDGRITARTPAYGYLFVDSRGRKGETSKKDTHYEINDQEASVVRIIFEQVANESSSLRNLAARLEQTFPRPKKMAHWEPKLIALIIRNPVYKGEFIAHRWQHVKIPIQSDNELIKNPSRFVQRKVQRPQEEWVVNPVPLIVSSELWERANLVLDKNIQMGRRNPKEPYLLTGLVKCATCGYTYVGGRKVKYGKKGQAWHLSYYRCAAKSARLPQVVHEIGCNQSQISSAVLDNAIWQNVYHVLLDPSILIDALEREYFSEQNKHLKQQIAFLESQILAKQVDDEKMYESFQRGAFDAYEYAERHSLLRDNCLRLQSELDNLQSQIMTLEKFESKKRLILKLAETAINSSLGMDGTFSDRQKIIKTVVNRIILNVNEGWFQLEGIVNGKFHLPGYKEFTGIGKKESRHLCSGSSLQ
jgi:site-specific DNA recombinase